MKIVQALGDDWNGLFINGELVLEGHTLRPKDVQDAVKEAGLLGEEIDFKEVDLDWMCDVGSFPNDISKVVWA